MTKDVLGYKFISTYLISDNITPIAKVITQMGGAIALVTITIALLLFLKNKKTGIAIAINLGIATLLNLLLEYIQVAGNTSNDIIEYDNRFGKEWYDFQNARSMGIELEVPKNNMPTTIYNNVYASAKKIAEYITSKNIVKYNLNSTNAEGNTSSDVIHNSYITQILSQVQENFKNKNNELAYTQLNELKSYIEVFESF